MNQQPERLMGENEKLISDSQDEATHKNELYAKLHALESQLKQAKTALEGAYTGDGRMSNLNISSANLEVDTLREIICNALAALSDNADQLEAKLNGGK